ncbi:hypothetical protein ITP53_11730 [Nonomuraea sp. K274]|uniref:Histidine kinase n=1 Tax=Nonomuraea cypriaca TaxID=1187855 RepID=A0A931AAB3_9ACTN|nr:histidine kinase [Nonomuraea cypriaca]MBF8186404.1 hypothetical protein [Nonomuraea cypriaca]
MYASVVAILVVGYVAVVALLAGGLRLSQTMAAALTAAGAALALAPLRNLAQSTVNRVMYGDRHDPASALTRLGTRLQAVRLHDDLIRSRAEVVASREDERRRLRRDLHDGLGPAPAAIGLKAGLAARTKPDGFPDRPGRMSRDGGTRAHPSWPPCGHGWSADSA